MKDLFDDSAALAPIPLMRFGTSSFSEKDWVGPFYAKGTQPRDYLSAYAEHFDTVEVDATYYAVPASSTVRGWDEKTPEGFLLSAKFPKGIVHGGRGPMPDPSIILQKDQTYAERDAFLKAMSLMGDKLGSLVIQFPYFNRSVFPSKGPFFERLDAFLEDLPLGPNYAVEIRNRQWMGEEFTSILRSHNCELVLVDQAWMPMGDDLAETLDPVTSQRSYIRLLGDRQEIEAITERWDRVVIDREEKLRRWARFLTRLTKGKTPALVYVNNHYAGHAPETTRRLMELVRAELEGPVEGP